MSETLDSAKKPDDAKINNIEHILDPKTFIRLFTTEKCGNEEKLIKEILQSICALRNSGGGKLTIWLTETSSRSEIDECMEIISNAMDDVLSESEGTDILDWESTNRLLTFWIKGSEEIVTMKYNMYVMEKDVAKLVPSTKSAAEVRLLLQKRKENSSMKHNTDIVGVKTTKLEKSIQHDHKEILESEWSDDDIIETRMLNTSYPMPRLGFSGGTGEYAPMQHSVVSSKSPILKFVKGIRVQFPADNKFAKSIHFESLKNIPKTSESVAKLLLQPENNLQEHVRHLALHHGGHVYYGISSDGIVHGINISKGEQTKVRKVKEKIMHTTLPCTFIVKVYLKAVKDKSRKNIRNLFVIGIYISFQSRVQRPQFHAPSNYCPVVPIVPLTFQITPETKIKTDAHKQFFTGQRIKTPTTSDMVMFKILKENKIYTNENNVADRITLDQNELLKYVSAFANHKGGELYYGIDSNGTVWGERFDEIERDMIQKEVEKKIASIMVWPKHVKEFHKFCKISFLPVRHSDDAYQRFVIKISVDRYPGGAFVNDPESYYVVRNRVVKLSFFKWIARIEDATTKIADPALAFGELEGKININLGSYLELTLPV